MIVDFLVKKQLDRNTLFGLNFAEFQRDCQTLDIMSENEVFQKLKLSKNVNDKKVHLN